MRPKHNKDVRRGRGFMGTPFIFLCGCSSTSASRGWGQVRSYNSYRKTSRVVLCRMALPASINDGSGQCLSISGGAWIGRLRHHTDGVPIHCTAQFKNYWREESML